MNIESLEHRKIDELPDDYWDNYESIGRETYAVPIYNAVWSALEARGQIPLQK